MSDQAKRDEENPPQDGSRSTRRKSGFDAAEAKPPSYRFPWLTWLIVAMLAASLLMYSDWQQGAEVATWKQFEQLLNDNGVKPGSVVLFNDRVEATLKPDYQTETVETAEGKATPVFVAIDADNRGFFIERLNQLNVNWEDETGGRWFTYLILWLPLLLVVGMIIYFATRARQMAEQGPAGMMGGFVQSQHREVNREQVDVSLDDVAGADEAKQEVQELIGFLKEPQRFQNVGARVPRGVLLQGPPGCGKTLLARAIAGEADVPFYTISGSDFMEMFVGVGARRVRDLFGRAKKSEPCMIFLDEIDAIGRKRGRQALPGGGHGEQEQTLNAILSEMDGFEPFDKVIVIAATNRPDVLDRALTRRGRFDRRVEIPLPDLKGRKEILKIHARKVKLADDADLDQLAHVTPMFSGADLEAVINEAAIIAVMEDRDRVTMSDLRQARDKLRFGRAQTSRRRDEEQRLTTAYHEAGHALLQIKLEDTDPIEKVTIIPRGKAQGGTFPFPEKERYGYGRKQLLATLRVMCGGRIAEEKKLGDASTGAADDIKKVTQLADKMAREWGMSDQLGFVRLTRDEDEQQWLVPQRSYSEQTAAKIDQEVHRLIEEAYHDAKDFLERNWEQVEALAEALLQRETLTAEEIKEILEGDNHSADDQTKRSQSSDAVAT